MLSDSDLKRLPYYMQREYQRAVKAGMLMYLSTIEHAAKLAVEVEHWKQARKTAWEEGEILRMDLGRANAECERLREGLDWFRHGNYVHKKRADDLLAMDLRRGDERGM